MVRAKTMSGKVKVLIVDDDAKESKNFAALLNGAGDDLVCDTTQPAKTVEKTAKLIEERLPAAKDARLVLLDYRLDDHQDTEFRGGTIAGYLRDQDPDLPIVLLTSEDKLHEWVERRPGMKQHFDWTLLKTDLAAKDAGASAHAQLVDLAQTCKAALGWTDSTEETWTRIGKLMGASAEGLEQFVALEPEPPRGDVPGDVVHWLLRRAHCLRGPLIDDATTRVMLGLTQASFEGASVMKWLEPARYKGCLQAFGRRWWTHLVGDQLATACGDTRPVDASERVRHLRAFLKTDLDSETCRWCRGERTLHACMVCRHAADAAHSLVPLGPPLPAWADPEIVCYRCVAEGKADHLRFPPSSQEIVKALVENRLTAPDE